MLFESLMQKSAFKPFIFVSNLFLDEDAVTTNSLQMTRVEGR